MKTKISCLLFALCSLLFVPTAHAAGEKFVACGPGYILGAGGKIDGIPTAECFKLWCRDLETGRPMGNENRAAAGYKATNAPGRLCDASGTCIECFGDRQWCAGENSGYWNPEYGAYTRGGGDTATYESYQSGSCFKWRLESPTCADGQVAILRNNEWTCATSTTGGAEITRESAVRRTGGSVLRLRPILK
jgi:hypothetical protein